MKIAMWSPTAFAGRKSSNLLLFALQAVTAGEGEQLVIHADHEGSGPEHFLLSGGQRRRMVSEKEFGVEFLASRMYCERFSKELTTNAAYTFAEGKLHVLPAGSKGFYDSDTKNVTDTISRIVTYSADYFQNVWIELPAGDTALGDRLLSEADCVIVNLSQSPFETEKANEIQKFKNAFCLVGAYEQRNIMSVHNLGLLYPGLKGRCAGIPYSPEFLAACCAGEAEVFLRRRMGQNEMKEPSAFLYMVEKAFSEWKVRCGSYRCG